MRTDSLEAAGVNSNTNAPTNRAPDAGATERNTYNAVTANWGNATNIGAVKRIKSNVVNDAHDYGVFDRNRCTHNAVGEASIGARHTNNAVSEASIGARHRNYAIGEASIGARHTNNAVGEASIGARHNAANCNNHNIEDTAICYRQREPFSTTLTSQEVGQFYNDEQFLQHCHCVLERRKLPEIINNYLDVDYKDARNQRMEAANKHNSSQVFHGRRSFFPDVTPACPFPCLKLSNGPCGCDYLYNNNTCDKPSTRRCEADPCRNNRRTECQDKLVTCKKVPAANCTAAEKSQQVCTNRSVDNVAAKPTCCQCTSGYCGSGACCRICGGVKYSGDACCRVDADWTTNDCKMVPTCAPKLNCRVLLDCDQLLGAICTPAIRSVDVNLKLCDGTTFTLSDVMFQYVHK